MKECTDVVLTRNQASKYVSMGNCCLFRLEQGIVLYVSVNNCSDQHHHRYNLCESLPILIKLGESMMESRSAIQVLGISPDRWSWWGLGAEGGQGWNQFTRMFFNITNITNNNNLFRFLALTLLHHNVAWRLATSLFRFSFFCIFEMPTFWDYFDSFLL